MNLINEWSMGSPPAAFLQVPLHPLTTFADIRSTIILSNPDAVYHSPYPITHSHARHN